MVGFTIPRAFVSMDPWSGTLLVGMPRGVTLPDGRDVGGYSLRKYADDVFRQINLRVVTS